MALHLAQICCLNDTYMIFCIDHKSDIVQVLRFGVLVVLLVWVIASLLRGVWFDLSCLFAAFHVFCSVLLLVFPSLVVSLRVVPHI